MMKVEKYRARVQLWSRGGERETMQNEPIVGDTVSIVGGGVWVWVWVQKIQTQGYLAVYVLKYIISVISLLTYCFFISSKHPLNKKIIFLRREFFCV